MDNFVSADEVRCSSSPFPELACAWSPSIEQNKQMSFLIALDDANKVCRKQTKKVPHHLAQISSNGRVLWTKRGRTVPILSALTRESHAIPTLTRHEADRVHGVCATWASTFDTRSPS